MWQDIKLLNATANTLLGALLLVLLASGVWWLAQRPMFTLKVIHVEGIADVQLLHVNALTIKATALPRIKGNFFTANLNTVRQAFEAVPWVRRASVRREWPNRLVVKLEEHEPLGTWGDEGRLLSVAGDVFTANLAEAEENGQLPEFNGPAGSEKEVVARFAELQAWFVPVNLAPESLTLSSRYAWSVKLNNGMTVELGREQTRTTLQERVARLIGIYPQLVARLQDRIDSVDLRYPNGMALKASGLVSGALKSGAPRKK
ncbi:cell division protein FtsQ/DivIB [Actimicrobium sp. CCI2.3]|uniref:cell division protein FtsQ/DivIB n=1 Tax=Actimicrobium sp. CCI2.3 TaxID=3048616 RepID=UPI002AB3C57B|nr:cell division protein FtsQ/DivIB [Actimicrobium sp. CCI2.3]MDY7573546.1 cell division protein FtsQ/DivIB [Actimicrobium sp. CCI2.3]MEB0022059.1 cell division protein FtsQ/DivIB [Actimicrobium sp. CCI2.3]